MSRVYHHLSSSTSVAGPVPSLSGPSLSTLDTNFTGNDGIELLGVTGGDLSNDSAATVVGAGPSSFADAVDFPAGAGVAAFRPTVHLQVQTAGKPLFSFPLPTRADPIPIFDVTPSNPASSTAAAAASAPKYMSVRPARSSGNCYLVRGVDFARGDDSDRHRHLSPGGGGGGGGPRPLSTTTYRFGPNRPPRVRLTAFPATPGGSRRPSSTLLTPVASGASDPFATPATSVRSDGASSVANVTYDEDGSEYDPAAAGENGDEEEDVEVRSAGLLTRAQTMRTPLGTFGWRYATRKERRAFPFSLLPPSAGDRDSGDGDGAAPEPPNSLLLFERVVSVAVAGRPAGKAERRRTVVGALVRAEGLRSPGSGPSSAGNGGRLMLDPRYGGDGEFRSDEDVEALEVLAVTTCIVMLKKEVDRRRMQQMAVMAAAASGGS